MLSANSSRALAPIVSMEVMSVGSLFLVLAAVPCGQEPTHGQKERVTAHRTHYFSPRRRGGGPAQSDLQRGVELRLVHLQVAQDGEDGEDGGVVAALDGSASREHDVVSFQHQVVQRLLRTNKTSEL